MRQASDLIFTESNVARAVKEMKKYDPEFDVLELQYEAEEVFKEFFCNFLAGNLEYLEKVSGMAGLAIVKGDIKRRETEGWRHKYTDILDSRNVLFQGGQVPEKMPPQFTFTIEIQEINCKVSVKDENQITDGGEENILQTSYRFVLSRHENPDMALTGHYWEIIEFNKVGELAQIV
jgi:Tim44-like domain